MSSPTVKHTVAAAGALVALLLAASSYAQTGPGAAKEPAAVDSTIRPFQTNTNG